MRIMFLVDGLRAGGAGRVVSRLANQLSDLDNKIYIGTVFDGVIKYDLKNTVSVVSFTNNENRNRDKFFSRISKIKNYCKKEKIEVVISFLTEINVYAILAGIGQKWKTVISERNNPYVEPRDQRVRMLRKVFYRFADGYVFQTEDAKKYFSKSIQLRSTIILNPVSDDIPKFVPKDRTKRIIAVGRLTEQKNYSMAIQAFARIAEDFPEYVLEIYGDGEKKDEILGMIEEMNLTDRVILKGHQTKLFEKIQDASLYIMTSNYEGMSNALIEAMALGLPVISTDHPIGGAKMLIKNGVNGFLVPTNDAYELAEMMKKVLGDKELEEKLSEEARKIRYSLDIKNISNEWTEYIQSIV